MIFPTDIVNNPHVFIKFFNGIQFFWCQLKIKYINVLNNSFFIYGFWNWYEIEINLKINYIFFYSKYVVKIVLTSRIYQNPDDLIYVTHRHSCSKYIFSYECLNIRILKLIIRAEVTTSIPHSSEPLSLRIRSVKLATNQFLEFVHK